MKQPNKRPPHRPPKFTPAQIIAALRAAGGIYADAARRLKCDRATVSRAVARHPETAAALDEIAEGTLDLAESALMRQLKNSKDNRAQLSAAQFMLRFRGAGRGYSQSQRTVRIDLGPIATATDVVAANARVVEAAAHGLMSPAEAKQLAELLDQRLSALASVETEARFARIEARLAEGMHKPH